MAALIDTYGEPSAALLSHYTGCCRYVSHQAGKNITSGQVQRIHAQGKTIVLNFEDSATNAAHGRGQGATDAEFAVSVARAVGAPHGVAIYFSVDYEVHSGPLLVATGDYFRGVAPVLRAAGYLVGAYGDKDLISALLNAKLVDFAWQTAAWSYGSRDSRSVLYQDKFTQGYDVDEIEGNYYGGWTPTGAQRSADWFDMATKQDLIDAINEAAAGAVWGGSIKNPTTGQVQPAWSFLQYLLTQDAKVLVPGVQDLEARVKALEAKAGA